MVWKEPVESPMSPEALRKRLVSEAHFPLQSPQMMKMPTKDWSRWIPGASAYHNKPYLCFAKMRQFLGLVWIVLQDEACCSDQLTAHESLQKSTREAEVVQMGM
ncbi:hypothetical protein GJ744_005617 [Endocarpon pusillum]|uniref:Uncharacterized protein n=1 Tax=Endocarpon pusillum TaxID=364733 RepID=A0A8H7A4K5_9EURO|nr:hypothetical protein GJ744_005617 [Endocarpon pusillum]